MTMFSTPKAPGSSAKKQPMAYSSLAAPSPLPSKSLFTCLSVLDEEESSSESGSPCILLDSDDIGDRQEGLKQDIKSPAAMHRAARRTTDSFRPVCSLQALSRSSKKILPRMSFSSPNIMRGKTNKRSQTDKAKKSRGGGVSQNDLTNVKLEMLNMHLDTKNEEVANLKSLLQQSEQKVFMLESKIISLEEELKQQQQVASPPLLELSFGSNSEFNTDHDSQTMSYVPEELLEDLTHQLKDKNQEIHSLEDEVEQWQHQANEWKNKYQTLVEQMQNGTVSDEESDDTNDVINLCNDSEDNLEVSGAEKDEEDANASNTSFCVDYERDRPLSKVEEIDGRVSTDTENTSYHCTRSPLRRSSIDSDEKMNNENGTAAKRSLTNRTPLGNSDIQNVQTPIHNTKRRSRRRQKTMRYTPAATVNKGEEVSSKAPTADDTLEGSVEFGEVGYKFRKWFGSNYGNYNGEVTQILPDGTRLCVYPADPNGDEYLTLEELSKTKPLKQPSHDRVTNSTNDEGDAYPAGLDEGSDGATDGVLWVKKNVYCHIW
jgi:hypothetical protein